MNVADPAEIVVRDRHRRDLGDLIDLRDSIATVGLLNPVLINGDGVLINGERRLRAYQQAFPGRPIPVRVVEHLDDAADALRAEMDENTCRKQMTTSELLSLGRALEELERPKAAANQGTRSDLNGTSGSPEPKVHVDEVVASALGIRPATYKRAKRVERVANDPEQSPEVRQVAAEALQSIDRGGSVRGAHDRVTASLNGSATTATSATPTTAPRIGKRYNGGHPQDTIPAAIHTLRGLTQGLTTVTDLAAIPLALRATWAEQLGEALRDLRTFHRLLKES